MNFKNILISGVVAATMLSATSCKDTFQEMNQNPNQVTTPNIPMLYANAVHLFDCTKYLSWFYNAQYTYHWVQAYVPTEGLNSIYVQHGATGDQGSQYFDILNYSRELDYQIGLLDASEGERYKQMRATLDVLLAYAVLFDTDLRGDIQFEHAFRYRFTNDKKDLTPPYDRLSDVYDDLIELLDNAIVVLTDTDGDYYNFTANENIYKGNVVNWARLANSVKLKIAVRLLHKDKTRAFTLAKEVTESPAGILTGTSDMFIHNKGKFYTGGSNTVAPQIGAMSKSLVDFLVANKDPRIRFFAEKNDYNSKVIQAFYDNGDDVPSYIEDNVNYVIDGGKKKFVSWKGAGEPWVRYYGLPTVINASQNSLYDDYFNNNNWKTGTGSSEKTYTPYSSFPEEMRRGGMTYTVPTAPGGPVIEDKEDAVIPYYDFLMSSAELNLYLAELKLLGADLPSSAADYFTLAIKNSVTEYDYYAGLLKIPYYKTTYGYDDNEVSIELKAGEIDDLLTQPAYQLTGTTAEQLEKVYIQEYIHNLWRPTDQFVTVRRSGIPKVGSSILAWYQDPLVKNTSIPRRFDWNTPDPTSLLFDVYNDALTNQNFDSNVKNTPTKLNSQRIWFDEGAPNFGEGPNF